MDPKNLDCKRVIEAVIAHLETNPGAPLSEEVQAHLRACEDCHGRAELERRLRAGASERLTCEEVMELLFVYLDQEVGDELGSRIEHHLETCRDCFSRAEFERRLRDRVRDSGRARAPERLHKRIRKVLDEF